MAVLVGTSLVIGGACAINNYIDRDIDAKMARTKQRALVEGSITPTHALVFGVLLALAGFVLLTVTTNFTTVLVGLVGFVDYLLFYSIFKRRSTFGTVVGSIAGATPIVAGYTAVTASFDVGALILFLILACWQMPHFYAIAIFRKKDYTAAGLPVLPIIKGVKAAKVQILVYILLFMAACGLLWSFGYTGLSYLIIVLFFSLNWLRLAILGFTATNDIEWARQMFKFSLIVLMIFNVVISLDAWLP